MTTPAPLRLSKSEVAQLTGSTQKGAKVTPTK